MIIHVDMDAFFASVEQRDDPNLRGRPVVVGAPAEARGVVAAASYEAREFGIRSAMPSSTAKRLCPDVIFLPNRIEYYGEVSKAIHEIFHRYTPLVESLSLDEAFLDVTQSTALFGSAEHIGRRIKSDIRAELDLAASVGIAENKFLAKLASDLEKPDGFVIVRPPVQPFLDPMPVSRLWGVGTRMQACLKKHGITTIREFRSAAPSALKACAGNAAEQLLKLAAGEDHRPVVSESQPKSISKETTFSQDLEDPETLQSVLLGLTQDVAVRVRRNGLRAGKVAVKLRNSEFETLTREETLPQPTDLTDDLWQTARRILERTLAETRPARFRLIGMRTSSFATGEREAELFEATPHEKQRKIDEVVDQINARLGKRTLQRGSSHVE